MLRITLVLCVLLLTSTASALCEAASVPNPQSLDTSQTQSPTSEGEQLLMILRDEQLQKSDPDRVTKAIRRLGDIREVAAIDDLIKLLTFKHIYAWEMERAIVRIHPISTDDRYPAVGALFVIGKPSLPALERVIETEEPGSLASENAVYTVTQIFRDAPSDGIEYLKEAAANASSPDAANRLSKAVEKIRKLQQLQQQ